MAKPLDPSAPIGVAIVGCGQIMTHHVAAMAASGARFEVRALCDPSAMRRATIGVLLAEVGLLSGGNAHPHPSHLKKGKASSANGRDDNRGVGSRWD